MITVRFYIIANQSKCVVFVFGSIRQYLLCHPWMLFKHRKVVWHSFYESQLLWGVISFFKGIAFSKVKQLISPWALSVMSTSLLLFHTQCNSCTFSMFLISILIKLKGFQKREIFLWSSMYLSQWRSVIIKKSSNDVFS